MLGKIYIISKNIFNIINCKMAKLKFKEMNKLKDLINNFISFLNDLKDKEKQKEALIVIKTNIDEIVEQLDQL